MIFSTNTNFSCYIVLTGQVAIYIDYHLAKTGTRQPHIIKVDTQSKEGETPAEEEWVDITTASFCPNRKQLGTFVVNLGIGAPVGEMALISTNVNRAAYVIADEDDTHLIRIDRELFNGTMKRMIEDDYRQD